MAIDPLPLDFGRDKKFCVYIYRDPRPRKKRRALYVGKGATRTRPDTHWKQGAQNKDLAVVLAAIKREGFEPIIEFVGFFDNDKEALSLEKSLITKFGRDDLGTGCLFNHKSGGGKRRSTRNYHACPDEEREQRRQFIELFCSSRMITRQQVRAARQLIPWTQAQLAKEAAQPLSVIKNYERGAMDPRTSVLAAIERAPDRGGVIFLEVGDIRTGGRGVRLKHRTGDDDAPGD